jgi:integrase
MSEALQMPVNLGLTRRAGSKNWQWSFPIPQDLQPLHQGKRQLRHSLGTDDRQEAEQKAAKLCTETLERFALERRQLNPQPLGDLTPELLQTLSDRVRADVLSLDDQVRQNPTTVGALFAAMAYQANHWDPATQAHPQALPLPPGLLPGEDHPAFMGATPGQLRTAQTFHAQTLALYRHALASGDLRAALPAAKRQTQALGILVDWESKTQGPQVAALLRKVLEALVQAHEGLEARDQGRVIQTPAKPEPPKASPKTKPAKLRDVWDAWKKSNPSRHPKTVRDTELALELFEELTGNPPLSDLTKAMGDDLRTKIQARCAEAKTASNKLNDINKLLTYAADSRGLMDRNPWAHLKIKYTKGKTKPWTADNLTKIFGGALFTAYELPTVVKAGRDAAYWVPLLALYMGARVSELAQLRTQDIRVANCATTKAPVHIIDITSEDEDEETGAKATRTKTAGSVRQVPIHAELIRLGFLDYAEDMRKAGHAQLFPHIRRREGKGAGDDLSTWFGKYRRTVGVEGPRRSLHQARHTLRTALGDAGATDTQSFAIGGWVDNGKSPGNAVYLHIAGMSPAKLREVLNRVSYPCLSLPRVYPKPSDQGSKA